jgi:hypothetical protein
LAGATLPPALHGKDEDEEGLAGATDIHDWIGPATAETTRPIIEINRSNQVYLWLG